LTRLGKNRTTPKDPSARVVRWGKLDREIFREKMSSKI